MTADLPDSPTDLWSDWLLYRRHGDDPEYDRRVRAAIDVYVERVLAGARLGPGMTLVDVGAGEGAVSFRAIEDVGPTLQVVLTDISRPMLRHAQRLAAERGVAAQCRFLRGSAERLEGIADESVDVVATRAVLAYVADKGAALREFHRVLKPGGRISLAEPIFRDEAFAASALRKAVDAQPPQSQDRFLRLLHRWKSAQFPDTDTLIAASPLVNFSERDLASLAHECRFTAIHLELHIDLQPSLVNGWDAFLRSSPHPWAPPLGHILAERFTPEERSFFEQVLRPTVESPDAVTIDRIAYVTAVKPPR